MTPQQLIGFAQKSGMYSLNTTQDDRYIFIEQFAELIVEYVEADRAQRQAGQEPGYTTGVDWEAVYTAPPAAPVPEGYEAIAVKGLGPLIDALERAESKGYLPDAVAEEWAAFDFRAL